LTFHDKASLPCLRSPFNTQTSDDSGYGGNGQNVRGKLVVVR
jgi:hypothetical protein